MDEEDRPLGESPALEAAFPSDDETNFIDLILCATELSEDEGEVRDLVDDFFEAHHDRLADLRQEHRSEA